MNDHPADGGLIDVSELGPAELQHLMESMKLRSNKYLLMEHINHHSAYATLGLQ